MPKPAARACSDPSRTSPRPSTAPISCARWRAARIRRRASMAGPPWPEPTGLVCRGPACPFTCLSVEDFPGAGKPVRPC